MVASARVSSDVIGMESDKTVFESFSSSCSGCGVGQQRAVAYDDRKADAESFTDQEYDVEFVKCNVQDVLSGRGKSNLKHPGNKKYQDLINANAERYFEEQNNDEKRRIQAAIILAIEQGGGKFLKPSQNNPHGWQRIPFEETRQKVAHALQYRVRVCREDEEGGLEEGTDAPKVSSESATSRKRGSASGRGSRTSGARKEKSHRTVARGMRNGTSPCGLMDPPAAESSSHRYDQQGHEESSFQDRHHQEYYGGPTVFGHSHGAGGDSVTVQDEHYPSNFAEYHPYHPSHGDVDASRDFLPILTASNTTSMIETRPFDPFNTGYTVIPTFGVSSDDSDDSTDMFRWSIQPDE